MKIGQCLGTAAMLLIVACGIASAEDVNLFQRYEGKLLKVHVAEVKDSASAHDVSPALLKTRLEEALKARKSIRFEIVPEPSAAELSIEIDIKDFQWTDHDPVDMLGGAAMIAMDTAVVECYAKIAADVTIRDVKSGRVQWQRNVISTVTKKDMSRADSVPLIADDFAKTLIKQTFSKKAGRR